MNTAFFVIKNVAIDCYQPLKKVDAQGKLLEEAVEITTQQANAIAEAWADFLLEHKEGENQS